MRKENKLVNAALRGLAQAKTISARASTGHSAKLEISCNSKGGCGSKQVGCGGKK